MFFKKRNKKDWHNPDAEFIGKIVSETKSLDGRRKAVIVKNENGNFYMYGYFLDDSDFIEGFSNVVGWVAQNTSITDTFEKANELSKEFLS